MIVDGGDGELDSDDDSSLDDYESDDSQSELANLVNKPSKKQKPDSKPNRASKEKQRSSESSKGTQYSRAYTALSDSGWCLMIGCHFRTRT